MSESVQRLLKRGMMGWHWVGETLRDGRPIPRDGEWLEHEGDLCMCTRGLHWSKLRGKGLVKCGKVQIV